jgi:hypothetical protein
MGDFWLVAAALALALQTVLLCYFNDFNRCIFDFFRCLCS